MNIWLTCNCREDLKKKKKKKLSDRTLWSVSAMAKCWQYFCVIETRDNYNLKILREKKIKEGRVG